MTAREYLSQAHRLDQRIQSDLAEIARLREMASSISSPGFGERHSPNQPTEAPFVRCVLKVMETEEKITGEIEQLMALKEQMRTVIDALPSVDEQMVVRYRYVHGKTWEEIGDELHSAPSSVRRWHNAALLHIVLPENPVQI